MIFFNVKIFIYNIFIYLFILMTTQNHIFLV